MSYVRGHYRRTPGGITFVSPHYRRGSSGLGGSRGSGDSDAIGVLAFLALVVFGVIAFVVVSIARVLMAHLLEVFAVLSAAVVIAVVVFLITELRKRRIYTYLDDCRELATTGTLDPKRMEKMAALATTLPVDSQLRQLEEEAIYRELIARILADGRIDDRERSVLQRLENAFVFDVGHAASMKLDAFTGLVVALRGHMDEHQEQHVRATARDLGLDSGDVEGLLRPLVEYREHVERQRQEEAARLAEGARLAAEQQAERERAMAEQREQRARVLAEQARLRAEQEAKLERDYLLATEARESATRDKISVTLRVPSTESPWYETSATHVKRLKKGDQRQAGTLLVTSRRLFFSGDSTITIRLDKILDVAVDVDDGTLRVIKDGRKQPFFFEVDQPLLALAHVERSLEEMAQA